METEILHQILNKLESMDSRLGKLEAGQTKLEAGQTKLEAGQSNLEADVRFVKDRVIVMEDEHGKKLDMLIDSQSANDEELNDIRLRLLRLEQAR